MGAPLALFVLGPSACGVVLSSLACRRAWFDTGSEESSKVKVESAVFLSSDKREFEGAVKSAPPQISITEFGQNEPIERK